MVLPYAIPAIFGTVRRSQEPIIPVERYALYPNFYEMPYWRHPRQPDEVPAKLTSRIAGFGLPRQAQDALKAAAESSDAWLAQGSKLNDAVVDLMRKGKSVFGERTVSVSGTSGCGSATGNAAFGASIGRYDLDVATLATAQKNMSYDLTKNAPSVIGAGTYTFTVQTGSETRLLSAVIRQGDTNAAMLGKLRDTVNDARLGVSASVREGLATGLVKLELAADETGLKNAFDIKDQTGSIISATGMNRRTEHASDARYQVNGGSYMDSASNDISLLQGSVTVSIASLKSLGQLSVKVEQNAAAIAEQLDGIIQQVNGLQAIYAEASGYLVPMLRSRIDEAVQGSGAVAVGVVRSEDGVWRLDREKLEAAMQALPDEVKRIFTGRSGLASRLHQTLDRFAGLSINALINPRAAGFHSLTLYGASSKTYLQLPLGGLYVNSFI
ncbi:hypothetical protein [Paenibacillus montanisoli]|uniref:Flagellar capping protein n=1 Tax=Paenibacillus montanisoli TaxID=2081970 RepID=A0A328U9R0_9BACL|nr:hypothetical protein [Paenibacillus montanisoli]RAP76964.1 hypothetical protein DL346_00180 [Paenibacillus montanisoli]